MEKRAREEAKNMSCICALIEDDESEECSYNTKETDSEDSHEETRPEAEEA